MPGGGSYGPANSIMNTIESGQGFYMKAGVNPGQVQFTEPAKTIGSSTVFFTPGHPQSITALLSMKQGSDIILTDGARVDFKNTFSNSVDINDANKLTNTNENVGINVGGQILEIEKHAAINEYDTIHLDVTGLHAADYVWNFTAENLDEPGRVGFLVDRFTHDETLLNLSGINTVDFSVNSTAGSYARDRFMILFKPASALPVTLTGITAVRQPDESIAVKWHAENEIGIHHYELQRSAEGINFVSLTNTIPTNNNGGAATYNYVDAKPLVGENYYRVKAISNNGEVQYTSIVKVTPLVKAGTNNGCAEPGKRLII